MLAIRYAKLSWGYTLRRRLAGFSSISSVPRESAEPSTKAGGDVGEKYVEWTVDETEHNTRLDRFVKRRAPGLPPGLIQKLIRRGKIRVRGDAPRRNAHPLRAQDTVQIPGDIKLGLTRGKKKPPEDDTTIQEAELVRSWVLHRDARCAVLNKPPGIATQGGSNIGERHVEAFLSGIGAGRYWLVHRLDKEASGTLVVARDVGAAALLAEYFRERKVVKTYWALVRGAPIRPDGIITAPVNGKTALTAYRTVKSADENCTWLELKPQTGRKHQLRIHCANVLGTPIVGERKYTSRLGLKALSIEPQGLHLHSQCIEFPQLTRVHPGGARPQLGPRLRTHVRVEAPLPPHMHSYWNALSLLNTHH